ncbi:hypothetical protein [Streptomyces xinghaiensis]|uniref:hypothetical protein n=1 Tax=Streptomyces xinghaiensis TaxID=1038928 RepID=UPI002E0FB0A7|nr:hypothetical protein OG463_27070 [Streptomyces xinghaiensis]
MTVQPHQSRTGMPGLPAQVPGGPVSAHRPRPAVAGPSQDLAGPFVREYTPKWPYRHPSAQVASVLYYRMRSTRVVNPEGDRGHWLRFFSRPYTVVDVQLGWHVAQFEVKLPTADSALFFPARVKVRWRVRDPYTVATSQVSDVAQLMIPELESRLREVTRRYAVHEVKAANEAVGEVLGGSDPGSAFGLELEVFADIGPDELTVRHTERVVEARHLTVLERIDQDLRRLKDEGERNSIREWTAHFQGALERGETALMAEMMARNPQDLPKIHAMLRNEQREARQDSMELIGRLIDGNLLETWQLGDQAQAVVEFLRTGTRRVVETAGDASHRVLDAGGGAAGGHEPARPRPFWEAEREDGPGGGSAPGAGPARPGGG